MDQIANFITTINNALKVSKKSVILPYSRLTFEISRVLEKEQFVEKVRKVKRSGKTKIHIELKYDPETKEPAIREFSQISKQSRRVYFPVKKIKVLGKKKGVYIISTTKGILTDKEAVKKNIGGEVICKLW